jgi:hypothetical protein
MSACTTTVHVPADSALIVNIVPDGCEPGGEAVQMAAVVCCIATGIDDGVPGGTLLGFVSVA